MKAPTSLFRSEHVPGQVVKVTCAALADSGGGDIILRGLIDPSSLSSLLVDPKYQRGVHSRKHTRDIMSGIPGRGSVPDIELGMRGHSFTEAGGDFFLHAPPYIIDGLQRTSAALEVLELGTQPRIGAMIHFDTDFAWENRRFGILNGSRIAVSPNIQIRNLVDQNKAVKLMLSLSESPVFVLCKRICWNQKMKRTELIHGKVMLT